MANCAHGFPQDQCLICQTLSGSGSAASARAPATATATAPGGYLQTTIQPHQLPEATSGALAGAQGKASQPARKRRSGFLGLIAVLALIGAGVLLAWAFAGVLDLAFHIAEYVALAVVAGWAGYKLGHAQGRRHARREGH